MSIKSVSYKRKSASPGGHLIKRAAVERPEDVLSRRIDLVPRHFFPEERLQFTEVILSELALEGGPPGRVDQLRQEV